MIYFYGYNKGIGAEDVRIATIGQFQPILFLLETANRRIEQGYVKYVS